jgi:hypothetical protein
MLGRESIGVVAEAHRPDAADDTRDDHRDRGQDEGAPSVYQVDIDRLIGEAVVIDCGFANGRSGR